VKTQTIVYVVNAKVPEEIRAEKICTTLAQAGHKVIVVCKWSGESKIREQKNGYLILRIGEGKGKLSACFPGNPVWTSALKSVMNEFRPTVLICREMFPMYSCIHAVKGKIPIILDMAEHYPAAMKEWKKYRTNLFARLLVHHLPIPEHIEAHAVRHARAIITVCEEQNQRLAQSYGVSETSMFIAHNTPDRNCFDGIRKGSRIPPIVFGHHGYFTLERNLEMLVLGFDIAASMHSNIQLLLAGTGETYSDVRAITQTLKSADRIEFTGAYSAQDLPELYGRTDIGILPYSEQIFRQFTLPNKAFDYMACGKPIISSGLEPMKRLLNETQAGIYGSCKTPNEIANLIDRMMHSDSIAMSRNGMQAHNDLYNWEKDGKKVLESIDYVTTP